MASLNKVQLIGNLGRDPEIKMTPSGAKVASFSIATTERFTNKNSGQKQEKTEWHNIVAWRQLADIIERYVKKGGAVYIEGKLTTRSWDDPQTGQKRYKTEIIAQQMQMLGGNRATESAEDPNFNQDTQNTDYNQSPSESAFNQDPGGIADDDLSF